MTGPEIESRLSLLRIAERGAGSSPAVLAGFETFSACGLLSMRECGSDEAVDSVMHDAEINADNRLARMKASLTRTGCGPARMLICFVLTQ
jgi:hypothetical protein